MLRQHEYVCVIVESNVVFDENLLIKPKVSVDYEWALIIPTPFYKIMAHKYINKICTIKLEHGKKVKLKYPTINVYLFINKKRRRRVFA